MLSDQWSPYVGRFACDWHRLPGGLLPGNHRPRLEPGRIVASGREPPAERSGRGQHADLGGSRSAKGSRALRRGGPGGKDVVDQDHHGRRTSDGAKCSSEGATALLARPPSLRRGFHRPHQQLPGWPTGQLGNGGGKQFGLIVASRPSTTWPERHPSDDQALLTTPVCRGRGAGNGLDHPRRQARGNRPSPAELQLHQGQPRRAFVEERRPSP
jgi:hypothetical protein